jgi:acetylornithine deacetylase/succinyl-diaminopimelate desuccinylase-like protein
MDLTTLRPRIDEVWDDEIVPTLTEYIRIPNVSPAYDEGWAAAGHMDRAVDLARDWIERRAIDGLAVEVLQLEGRTPLLLVEVPATGGAGSSDTDPTDTVLLYGHLDKQPPMTGWRDGLGPWEPVVADGRLYGRGGADDGYAGFAALTAIEAVRASGGSHARCVVLIECSEESGSPDLPAHLDQIGDRLGTPSLVVCLDSGCATYDRLWVTTSLRGVLVGRLRVDVLTEGVHSGSAGGVVPSSFRVLRRLLDRIEDPDTGRILLPDLHGEIPDERRRAVVDAAEDLDVEVQTFPYAGTTQPVWGDPVARQLARTWEPSLAVTGMDGIPPGAQAGAVLRPFTSAVLSIRLPPRIDPDAAGVAVGAALEADPPHGAQVRFTVHDGASGWDAPATAPWLADALEAASQTEFGQPVGRMGEGGTIPFMALLGHRFPDAQFMVTGVLGPASNAHGPNEFLDLETGRRVTAAVAHVLDAHARR